MSLYKVYSIIPESWKSVKQELSDLMISWEEEGSYS